MCLARLGTWGLTPRVPVPAAVVAFDRTVEYDVRSVGNCRTCCLGGEGCFNTKLTGPVRSCRARAGCAPTRTPRARAPRAWTCSTSHTAAVVFGVAWACHLPSANAAAPVLLLAQGAVYLQTISYEKLRRLLVTEHSEGDKSGGGGDGGAPLLTPEKMFR